MKRRLNIIERLGIFFLAPIISVGFSLFVLVGVTVMLMYGAITKTLELKIDG